MASKGTGWIVRRSRDLVPRLVQLAMAEWWHGVRGRDAGQAAAHQAAADQPAADQPAAHQPAAYQAAAHQAAAHQAAVDRDAGPYPAVLRGR
jgi:hypothetical protein